MLSTISAVKTADRDPPYGLIDAVGSSEGVNAGLRWLKDGPFKERRIKLIGMTEQGRPQVQALNDLMAAAKGAPA